MKLAVVIPAYNACTLLANTVQRILASTGERAMRIVIVNDGSSDHTREVAEMLAADHPLITVIHRSANGGYGAAMKTGLTAARDAGADAVACVHADGQYSPEQLPHLLALLAEQNLDLVQGSRIASGTALSGGMPAYKYVANRLLTCLANRVFALTLTDYFSGYLLYGPRALTILDFQHLSDGFEFDLEVIASARAQGLKIAEWPIPTHYGQEISHLRPIDYGFRVLNVLHKYRRGYYRDSHQ